MEKNAVPNPGSSRARDENAVNLGQLFLSPNSAHLTFTEGKVSLQIGGSEVYLEEKG